MAHCRLAALSRCSACVACAACHRLPASCAPYLQLTMAHPTSRSRPRAGDDRGRRWRRCCRYAAARPSDLPTAATALLDFLCCFRSHVPAPDLYTIRFDGINKHSVTTAQQASLGDMTAAGVGAENQGNRRMIGGRFRRRRIRQVEGNRGVSSGKQQAGIGVGEGKTDDSHVQSCICIQVSPGHDPWLPASEVRLFRSLPWRRPARLCSPRQTPEHRGVGPCGMRVGRARARSQQAQRLRPNQRRGRTTGWQLGWQLVGNLDHLKGGTT